LWNISSQDTYEATFCLPRREGNLHLALVFPVRDPSRVTLCFSLSHTFRFPAAKDLQSGLKSLHDAEIVHPVKLSRDHSPDTRKLSIPVDLNSRAVLWNIDPIDHWTTAGNYRRLGRPRKVPVTEAEGKHGELVE